MDIIVQLQTEVAKALHEGLSRQDLPTGALDLLTTIAHYGAEIRPQHPRSTDPQLTTFFTVAGVTGERAIQLRQALAELEVVKAAYMKPVPTMP